MDKPECPQKREAGVDQMHPGKGDVKTESRMIWPQAMG